MQIGMNRMWLLALEISFTLVTFRSRIMPLLGLIKSDPQRAYRQILSNTETESYLRKVKSGDYIFRYFIIIEETGLDLIK